MPLNDTHHAILRNAAERADRLLTAPENTKPRTLKALAKALVGSGLVAEVAVTADQPSWVGAEGAATGLQLTTAGLAEIGVELEPPAVSTVPIDSDAATRPVRMRPHSKLARMIGLLQRTEGATLDDLIAATGWLPHSTRAALTGLRKRGYSLERSRNGEGQTCYLLTGDPGATGTA